MDGLAGTNRSTKGEAGTVECRQKGSKPGEATWDDWAQAKGLTPDRVTLWPGGRLGGHGGRDFLPLPSPSLFFKIHFSLFGLHLLLYRTLALSLPAG